MVWYFISLFSLVFSDNKKAVYVSSFDKDLKLILASLHLPAGKMVMDLWCGDGKALRFFARNYGMKWYGYDINFWAIMYGKLLNYRKNFDQISLLQTDFSRADFGQADYIYLYLFPEQLADMEERFFSSLCPWTIVISNTFQFPQKVPFQTIVDSRWKAKIFLYQ